MKLKTSKGKTFDVEWAWGPVGDNGALVLEMIDDRDLPDIAKDFWNVDKYERFSDTEGTMIFEGYTELSSITRTYSRSGSKVQISVIKPYTR